MLSRIFRLGFITGVIIAGCVAGASFSFAQEFRASILGQVADPSGARIARATVTAVEHSTHHTYTAQSDSAGVYSVDFILPGEFTVTIEAQGFRKEVYPNVTLHTAQKLNLNVTLSVGPAHQEVTVTASPGLLDASDAATGGIVDQTRIQLMPSEGRDSYMDLSFVQGIMQHITTWGTNTLKTDYASLYSVNGAPSADNYWYLNGAPVSTGNNWNFSATQDAVQEVQASVGMYDAQYGPGAGASFNQVLKEGTNRFHGNLYSYNQNTYLVADSWANDLAGIKKPISNLTYIGANGGGPIQKDKTFFYASYEGQRVDQPVTWTSSVPTAAEAQGNFAGTGYTIYDPTTVKCTVTTSSGCSTYGRTAFANNVIPSANISPIGAAIMALYNAPTNAALLNNFVTGTSPRSSKYDQYLGRLDHVFSTSTRVSAIFTRQTAYGTGGTTNGFKGEGSTNTVPLSPFDINGIVDFTRTLSPSLVADFRASFGRLTGFTTTGTALGDKYSVPGLTMPFIPTASEQNIAPQVAVTNYASLIGNTANGTISNYWYLSPSLEQIKGRHTFHYGFQFQHIQSGADGVPSNTNGSFSFSGQWSRANPLTATTGTGNGLADLLLGYPASGSVLWGINNLITWRYYAAYFQDDFKVSKKVTINMGLRWDVDTSPSERHNGINGGFCFTCTNPYTAQINYATYPTLQNPLTGGLTFAGVTAPHAPGDVHFTHWQPRVGIAWAITPKWVLRAGFGMFYNIGNSATTTTGFTQTTSYVASLDGSVHPTNYFLSGKPFPNGVLAPSGASGGLATSAGNAISYVSPSGLGAVPWTEHWSVGFQRALPKRMLLDVEYVGSHNHAIAVSQPWGVISSAQQAACFASSAVCNNSVSNPFYGILPSTATLGASPTLSAYQLMRQYPLFNGVTQSNDPIGYEVYNALQVRVERQVKSIDFVWNYAYSNLMGNTAYQNAGTWRDANLWHGPSNLDVRHFFNMNAVWPLPVGKGGVFFQNAHGLVGQLINHWVVDELYIYWTGIPLAISNANLVGGPGCTSYYPVGGQTRAHWFNNTESCYQQLSTWQERTTPLYVGYLRNPQRQTMNSALQKSFALPWREMSLTMRLEFENTLNNPGLGGPNTTVTALPTFTQWVGWSGFGTITSTSNTNRMGQFSLRITF
ncbi:MAG: TonB-dependent receptor [Terriglobia bacterium]